MEKRKDTKGRNLHDGEDQMKDGRYRYRYTDPLGKRRVIYSWKLVGTDKVPAGKRDADSLRQMERKIEKDLEDGIDSKAAEKLTVSQMYQAYMGLKQIRESTRQCYEAIYHRYIEDTLGPKKLEVIRPSVMQGYFKSLSEDRHLKPHSLRNVYALLHPMFDLAVRDGYIRMNPTDGLLPSFKKDGKWQDEPRRALTPAEQSAFLGYLEQSDLYRHWKPLFVFLLGTGCRIGEALGLTWNDVDFEKNLIRISHAIVYLQDETGKHIYRMSTPKTNSGIRTIPMLSKVRAALLQEKQNQELLGIRSKAVIDGYTGFVFINGNGNVHAKENINNLIRKICLEYNTQESEKAARENRDPALIQRFSVHNLRHTFCTRLCESGMNIKMIQDIMGHSSIQTTMNIYAEVTERSKEAAFEELDGKVF